MSLRHKAGNVPPPCDCLSGNTAVYFSSHNPSSAKSIARYRRGLQPDRRLSLIRTRGRSRADSPRAAPRPARRSAAERSPRTDSCGTRVWAAPSRDARHGAGRGDTSGAWLSVTRTERSRVLSTLTAQKENACGRPCPEGEREILGPWEKTAPQQPAAPSVLSAGTVVSHART